LRLKRASEGFRGLRGLLEALVGFCKASEDFEENFRGLHGAPGGFSRIFRCFGGIREAMVGFRGLQRASEGFRGLQRALEASESFRGLQRASLGFRGLRGL